MIVSDTAGLEELCTRLQDAGSFALDTEFVRERTYYIQLGTIQVAISDVAAILDPHSIETLEPFFELLRTPTVEKVVHSGEQDLAIFFDRMGEPPKNVFDTQIAAAIVGYGEQVAYANLVQKVTGVSLSKLETLTDWTARPLTRRQIAYALEDVRHLPVLREHLGRRLSELGRGDWAREAFVRLEERATYAPLSPGEVYKRIKYGGLNGVQLGVLRELAAWREGEAMRRNIPRTWVLTDQTLLQIARQKPETKTGLSRIRSIKRRELERSAADILAAVARGRSAPVGDESRRRSTYRPKLQARAKPLRKLLQAWLYARAAKVKITPSMLASRDELSSIVEGHLVGEIPPAPVLTGWRLELVGQDLLDILAGKLKVAIDPGTGELTGAEEDS